MPFDLPNAAPPELIALQLSHTRDDSIEADIKRLALDLFRDYLGEDAFDANVLGMAHLGSFDLVRRFIQADGLGMLRSDREEAAMRYLYRAWKASDTQGRGLHFLRTYLQLLFPGEAEVQQLWHAKDHPYGTAWRSGQSRYLLHHFLGQAGVRLDGAWRLGQSLVPLGELPPLYTPDPSGIFLTSRIEILLSLELATRAEYQAPGGGYVFGPLLEIIRAIIPARLVPAFRFWLRFVLYVHLRLSERLRLFKNVDLRYPWCGRVLSEAVSARWSLGPDPQFVRLPQPFGTFCVGEQRGSSLTWRLRPCRASGSLAGEKRLAVDAYDLMPRTGEPWRRLGDGWALGRRRSNEMLSVAQLEQRADLSAQAHIQTVLGEHIRLDYPFTPKRVGRMLRLDGRWRLGTGHTLWRSYHPLDGAWALRPGERFWAGGGPLLDGRWTLGRALPIPASADTLARLNAPIVAAPERLPPNPSGVRVRAILPWSLGRFALIDPAHRRPTQSLTRSWSLDGRPLGRPAAALTARGYLRRVNAAIETQADCRHIFRRQIPLSLPAVPTRLGRSLALDGRWQLGAGVTLTPTICAPRLSGWPLRSSTPIRVDASFQWRADMTLLGRAPTLGRTYSRRIHRRPRPLDGSWTLKAFHQLGQFRLDGRAALKTRKMTQSQVLGQFRLMRNEARRAWPIYDETAVWRDQPALNGTWRVGASPIQASASLIIIKR